MIDVIYGFEIRERDRLRKKKRMNGEKRKANREWGKGIVNLVTLSTSTVQHLLRKKQDVLWCSK